MANVVVGKLSLKLKSGELDGGLLAVGSASAENPLASLRDELAIFKDAVVEQ